MNTLVRKIICTQDHNLCKYQALHTFFIEGESMTKQRYMMITRLSIPDIREAGRNLTAVIENSADTLLATNIVLTMIDEVMNERTFRIEAIDYNISIDFSNDESYILEYDPKKLKAGSIFIFMLRVLSQWNEKSDGASWEYREDKSQSILLDILRSKEL